MKPGVENSFYGAKLDNDFAERKANFSKVGTLEEMQKSLRSCCDLLPEICREICS